MFKLTGHNSFVSATVSRVWSDSATVSRVWSDSVTVFTASVTVLIVFTVWCNSVTF